MLLLALVLACSDTTFSVDGQVNDAAPDIEVEPATLDLGAVPLDEQSEGEITIRNVGNAALTVTGVDIDSGTGAFSLAEAVDGLRIEPGTSVLVAVRFQPFNDADLGTATVTSDDPDEPALPVALVGRGAFPQLSITPSPLSLGSVELCEAGESSLTLSNTGEDDLELTTALLAGEGMTLLDLDALPLWLEPGASSQARVAFAPERAAAVVGELWVDSNDPAGARMVSVSGTGVVDGLVSGTDTFRQPDGPWERTDILFFVDRSCSMKDDEANLRNNIGLLADQLDAAASDWQLMVTIDDNGCREGDFMTSETEELVTSFTESLAVAPGDFTEAGLTIVTGAVERAVGGGCNDGFLRSDSKTLLVTISDEPEQSYESWESHVARIQAVAPSAAVVAVVGDVPDGCATAEPGTGYVDAAMATGGVFLSVCSAEWGSYFDVVGDLATSGPQDAFALSQLPEPDTITVDVDGETWLDWSYDADSNSVVFSNRPDALSLITVQYSLGRDCG